MPRRKREVPSVVGRELEHEREPAEAPPLWEGVSDREHPVGERRRSGER